MMKIGIIVFSKTNNTFSIAERLRDALVKRGLDVVIDRVIPVSDDPGPKDSIEFRHLPDVSDYDVIIFGSPVWAFSLSWVMKAYLTQVSSLSGKKVFSFVTKQMASKFTGGNKAIRQIRSAVEAKNAKVDNSFIISWKSKNREKEIADCIDQIAKSL
ncbi:flavodoxin family protein [Acetobacterium tundrae]|uniref:Flavodoxin n=2 Tax=Acetobacterium tundrae TaxID=132932 RepID=A0ABR6WP10_9FIRM|nr:NAD(P)H-dependent oxidoreductase [Acetobacterium tundrae]MBC3798142.1 flavodoxin [Acetobacterium tundrae]